MKNKLLLCILYCAWLLICLVVVAADASNDRRKPKKARDRRRRRTPRPTIATDTVPSFVPTASPSVDVTPSVYNIQYEFVSTITNQNILNAFFAAKKRWERVIQTELPDSVSLPRGFCGCGSDDPYTCINRKIDFDDLLIYVRVGPIDGEGRILGQAGPCMISTVPIYYTRIGAMDFDVADLTSMAEDGILESVIAHEIGHIIGIGTWWDHFKLSSGTQYRYKGANGNEGNADIGFEGEALIENTGGGGTQGAHWRESTYDRELMTGYVDAKNPMSALTVKSLMDMGYAVDLSRIEPYTPPSNSGRRRRFLRNKKKVFLQNDVKKRDSYMFNVHLVQRRQKKNANVNV